MAKPKQVTALAKLVEDDLGLPFEAPAPTPPKPGGPKASPAQVQDWTRGFAQNLATLKRVRDANEATVGTLAHTLGTTVRQLRGHSAWLVAGLPSWEAFCEERLGVSERHARRLDRFAELVSDEQAAFGIRKCLAGIGLAKRLKVESLHALLVPKGGAEPPAWAALLGEPVGFATSTATRLERLLAGPKALPPRKVKPSDREAAVVRLRRETIARVAGRHPALAALEPRSFPYRGRAQIRHKPASTEQDVAALAALYAALARGS